MQCPTCSATLPDDARFCGECGSDLAAVPQPVPPPLPPTVPMPPAAPPYPPQASQPPPPGYPPVYAAPVPEAQPGAPKRNVGLVVGIVVGILVLLLLCAGVGVYFGIPAIIAFQGAKQAISVSPTAGSPAVSSQGEQPATELPAGEPGATNPEPPVAEPAPAPATPALSDVSAKALVLDYLGKATAGQSAEAKSMVTSKYISRITSDYYKLAATDLKKFDLVKVEQGQGGYMVFVKESWASGVWTNWYLVVLKDGKLVINDTGTE